MKGNLCDASCGRCDVEVYDLHQPPPVWIELLGEFRVVLRKSPSESLKFRSHTAERLLASLALRLGHSILKSDLVDALWPDSDGDRQSQNLRKAISDVRRALGSPSLLLAQADRHWLDADSVRTDVADFKQLTNAGLEGDEPETNLRKAAQIYAGPLVSDYQEPWFHVHRMELEERFGQTIEHLIHLLLSSGNHDDALRIGRHAVTVAPYREDVHIALMSAYASAGLRTEAIRQYEELEVLLENHWGEAPSPNSSKAYQALWELENKPAQISPQESIGGAMPATSSFYIVRECDHALKTAISRGDGTILIHGPRQVGKTSLLFGVLGREKLKASRVVITDFQVLSKQQLADANAFCKALAYGFATQLGVKIDLAGMWNEWIGPNMNLHSAIEQVLREVDTPVFWAMDEADRLFGVEFSDDFFGLIRSWHNLRAVDDQGPFSKLTLIISYATEASLFIQDINQSPFNVGTRIPVLDFSEPEIRELSVRYGLKLLSNEVRLVWEITHGQPFLSRKVLDLAANQGKPLVSIQADASNEDGLFGDHLRRLLLACSRDAHTKAEVILFLQGKPFLDPKTQWRLIAGGMIVRTGTGQLEFRVPAYRGFLTRYLIAPD